MKCPKCGSELDIQVVTVQKMKNKHSKIYWCLIGWWLNPLLWLFLTLPMLIIHLFKPKNYKLEANVKKVAVCKTCGYTKTLGGNVK